MSDETINLNDGRVVNTAGLLALALDGRDCMFNRQLDGGLLMQVADPAGVHMLTVVLPFHNGTDQADPHHRCRVLIKTPDSIDPTEALIDVRVTMWERLTTASEYLEA